MQSQTHNICAYTVWFNSKNTTGVPHWMCNSLLALSWLLMVFNKDLFWVVLFSEGTGHLVTFTVVNLVANVSLTNLVSIVFIKHCVAMVLTLLASGTHAVRNTHWREGVDSKPCSVREPMSANQNLWHVRYSFNHLTAVWEQMNGPHLVYTAQQTTSDNTEFFPPILKWIMWLKNFFHMGLTSLWA